MRGAKGDLGQVTVFFGLGIAAVTALVAVVIVAYSAVFTEKIYPGVRTLNAEIGGRSAAEAQEILRARFNGFAERPLVLRYGQTIWQTSPVELGLRLDMDATWDSAFDVGRRGSLPGQIAERVSLLWTSTEVNPVLTVDRERTASVLAKISAEIERPPKNATIAIRDDGKIDVLASQAGERIDRARALGLIESSLLTFDLAAVELPVETVLPEIDERALIEAQTNGSTLISTPLILTAPGQEWTLSPRELVALVSISREVAGVPHIEFSRTRTESLLDRIASAVEKSAVDANLVVDDDGVSIKPESAGFLLDRDQTFQSIHDRTGQPGERIQVSLQTVAPKIVSSDLNPAWERAHQLVGQPVDVYFG
ncbi:MAG TPA: peptidoglycan binding domain-containing protein, partial [Chloroflexota bacterium]|nr:peptidoglycan binding domain-containing protein [Chloroflexota bacterium]